MDQVPVQPAQSAPAPDTEPQIVLASWRLMDGRRNRLLQVVSDAPGWRPIDVLADGKPILTIDRPSANGPRSDECDLFEGHLLVRLTSPDDGTTVRCEVYLKGRKLDPAQPEVALAEPATRWGSCWGRVTISLLAFAFALGLAGSLDRNFGRGGNPHPAVLLVGAGIWAAFWPLKRTSAPFRRWLRERGWPWILTALADIVVGLALFGCVAVVAVWALNQF